MLHRWGGGLAGPAAEHLPHSPRLPQVPSSLPPPAVATYLQTAGRHPPVHRREALWRRAQATKNPAGDEAPTYYTPAALSLLLVASWGAFLGRPGLLVCVPPSGATERLLRTAGLGMLGAAQARQGPGPRTSTKQRRLADYSMDCPMGGLLPGQCSPCSLPAGKPTPGRIQRPLAASAGGRRQRRTGTCLAPASRLLLL